MKIMGFDAFYCPNDNDQARDLLYGEDPVKKFESAFPLEMYLSSDPLDYQGQQEFFSKFGLEIKDVVKVMVSRRSFQQRVPQNTFNRPREGDLVYVPFLNGTGELYEITFAEQSKDMHMLGRKQPYFYELRLEKFKYSQEFINTGVEDIDHIVNDSAYMIKLNCGPAITTTTTITYTNGVDGSFSVDPVSSGSFGVSGPNTDLYTTFNNNALAGKLVTFHTASGNFTTTITSSGSMGAGFVFCHFTGTSGPNAAVTSLSLAGATQTAIKDYTIHEICYQAADSTQANATAVALVQTWSSSNNELMVSNISGEFIDGQVIIGASSNAQHILLNYDPLLDNSFNETYSNKVLQTEANSIIDFSESNPFGSL